MKLGGMFNWIIMLGLVSIFIVACEPTDFSEVDLYGTSDTEDPTPDPTSDPTPDPTPDPDPDPDPDPSNGPATGHAIGAISAPEKCGNMKGDRPSIAVDSKDQPHVVVDKGSGNTIWICSKIGSDWRDATLAKGSKGGTYDASRLYMPHIEIDSKDRAWISCKMGTKEYGSMQGEGLWQFKNMTTGPKKAWFRYLALHKGNGNVSIDPYRPNEGTMMASYGLWQRVDEDGKKKASGQMVIGSSGEKIRFLISARSGKSGVWHAAMGGWSKQPSSYQNSSRDYNKKSSVVWADYGKYPEQGEDLSHPAIGIDLKYPTVCYISATYHPGVVINVWNGEKFVWSNKSLKVLDGSGDSGSDRFGPQWTPVKGGGAFVSWTRKHRIKIRYVSPTGSLGSTVDVCSGRAAAMCTDSNGHIRMVYEDDGMKYRKISLQ